MNWKFDSKIANIFVEHAKQHIPNYNLVIDKCVDICKYYLKANSSIVDIGSATGETLRKLHTAGFTNLTGVESSADMLEVCDTSIARYIYSNIFPSEPFDAVLCNWTLHFIEDKEKYLMDIHRNLNAGGVFILSEKTNLNPMSIKLYHEWKHRQGVSWSDIAAKEQAVKNIMYIQDLKWYIDTLDRIGFREIQIIDASWCFTTFCCIK
jgi:tRNA (cmo5U34)-methyltransferase